MNDRAAARAQVPTQSEPEQTRRALAARLQSGLPPLPLPPAPSMWAAVTMMHQALGWLADVLVG